MSILEELKKLDAQREKLIAGAKSKALDNAEKAIAELNELGFHYQIVEARGDRKSNSTGIRRTGIKAELITVIRGHQAGIGRADILEKMGVKGDKAAEGSVSNALVNAKKKGEIIQTTDGKYKAVPSE